MNKIEKPKKILARPKNTKKSVRPLMQKKIWPVLICDPL